MLRQRILMVASLALIISGLFAMPVQAAKCDEGSVLGIPTWYRGLGKNVGDECEIKQVGEEIKLFDFLTIIIINIGDMVAHFIGIASFLFIIVAGFKYVLAQGEEAMVAKAKKTLSNAVIGLVISVMAVVIINIIFGVLV